MISYNLSQANIITNKISFKFNLEKYRRKFNKQEAILKTADRSENINYKHFF